MKMTVEVKMRPKYPRMISYGIDYGTPIEVYTDVCSCRLAENGPFLVIVQGQHEDYTFINLADIERYHIVREKNT